MGRVWPESGEEIVGFESKGLTKRRKNGPPGRRPPDYHNIRFLFAKKGSIPAVARSHPNTESIRRLFFLLKGAEFSFWSPDDTNLLRRRMSARCRQGTGLDDPQRKSVSTKNEQLPIPLLRWWSTVLPLGNYILMRT